MTYPLTFKQIWKPIVYLATLTSFLVPHYIYQPIIDKDAREERSMLAKEVEKHSIEFDQMEANFRKREASRYVDK